MIVNFELVIGIRILICFSRKNETLRVLDDLQAGIEAEQIASGTDRTGILMYPNRVDTSGR